MHSRIVVAVSSLALGMVGFLWVCMLKALFSAPGDGFLMWYHNKRMHPKGSLGANGERIRHYANCAATV